MRSDRRVQYTQKAIRDAFLTLLESTSMEHITVKEICNLADINRATFYRNYADLYALYDAIEEEMQNAAFPNDSDSFSILELLHLIQENKAFYREVFRRTTISPSSLRIINRFSTEMRQRLAHRCQPEDYDLYLRYAVYGVGGLLRDWLESDCDVEPVLFASQIERITELMMHIEK